MEKLIKVSKSIYLPFIIFVIILLCIHIPVQRNGDDLIMFYGALNDKSIVQFLLDRYNEWSSRTVIEFFLVILDNIDNSMILWKILDPFVFLLLAYSIYQIFIKDIKDKNIKLELTYLSLLAILLLPVSVFSETGWLSTTTNYLWVVSTGMYVCTLLKKSYYVEKVRWYESILLVLSTLYGANQEQMAAVLFGIFTLYIFNAIIKKDIKTKINKDIIIEYILITLSLVYILNCPR